MNFYNPVLYLFIFSINYLGNDVSAFKSESIIGGYYGRQADFSYLVAILGRRNASDEPALICGGSILTDMFIISAAHCFVKHDNMFSLRDLSFSVLAGSSDITVKSLGIDIPVDLIYMPFYIVYLTINDIAILRLKYSLSRCKGCILSAVELPSANEPISETVAAVSGYGYSWIEIGYDPTNYKKVRRGGGTSYLLKYAFVQIVDNNRCRKSYTDVNLNKQYCGIMLSEKDEPWGNCALDSGNPLVRRKKLVGIVSRSTHECDDTFKGGVYTNVSEYLSFINIVLHGLLPVNVIVFSNSPHKA